jgi:hypothetical protein
MVFFSFSVLLTGQAVSSLPAPFIFKISKSFYLVQMSLFRVVVVIISPGYTNPWSVFYFIYFSNRQPENATVPPTIISSHREGKTKKKSRTRRERKKEGLFI